MCNFITAVVLRKDIYGMKLTPTPYLLRIRIWAAPDKYSQSRDWEIGNPDCAGCVWSLFIYFKWQRNLKCLWIQLLSPAWHIKPVFAMHLSFSWVGLYDVMTYCIHCSDIWCSAFSGYLFSGSAKCVQIIKHISIELLKVEVVKLWWGPPGALAMY